MRIINVTPDGTALLLQDVSNILQILDTRTWQPRFASLALSNRVSQVWLDPKQQLLLGLTRKGGHEAKGCILQRWKLPTGQLLNTASVTVKSGDTVVPSPDCVQIAVFGGRHVEVFDSRTGKSAWPAISSSQSIQQMKFAPNSRSFLVTSGSKVEVYDAAIGKPLFPPLKHSCPVSHAEFSNDGRCIATSCSDSKLEPREARVWNAHTGQPLSPPLRHGDGVFHAAFSSDGRSVVTASEDGTARLWNAVTGEPLTPQMRHSIAVNHASCSPDGKWIATASHDKTARVWDARTGEPLTPRLKHPSLTMPWGGDKGVDLAIFLAGGRHLLTRYSSVLNYIWELPWDERPAQDLALLAGLLAGHRLDSTGALEPLGSEALRSAWQRLRTTYPQDFAFEQFNLEIPRRDPHARPQHIDLTCYYNASLSEAFNLNSSAWERNQGPHRTSIQSGSGLARYYRAQASGERVAGQRTKVQTAVSIDNRLHLHRQGGEWRLGYDGSRRGLLAGDRLHPRGVRRGRTIMASHRTPGRSGVGSHTRSDDCARHNPTAT
jgi:hypothetical protein